MIAYIRVIVYTIPFHLASPREMEKSKFDLMIYFLLSHS